MGSSRKVREDKAYEALAELTANRDKLKPWQVCRRRNLDQYIDEETQVLLDLQTSTRRG